MLADRQVTNGAKRSDSTKTEAQAEIFYSAPKLSKEKPNFLNFQFILSRMAVTIDLLATQLAGAEIGWWKAHHRKDKDQF